MSKTKRILASAMALMLVFCVGYYSMMSQTSAWFYDSGTYDSGDSFIFGDVSVNTKFIINNTVVFDMPTKLADESEMLFDEALNIDEINVTNAGTVPIKLSVEVENEGVSLEGLRWFVYTDDMLVNGSVRETIKANVATLNKQELDEYNSSKTVTLAQNQEGVIKIATWVEYDEVAKAIQNNGSVQYNTRLYLAGTPVSNY